MTQARLDHVTHASWRVSSHSGGQGECVEVAVNAAHVVPVRDSKRPTGPILGFTHDAWGSFLDQLG
ncbi:DUF397 domain-containing protein [Yinghuangia sp. YIM S10712]|uniref:DUF397 domain-containing protein n=1 Tax=Yinghuangia sp. YIM S10712 TaxID=3436930 RepID=UPI003F53C189